MFLGHDWSWWLPTFTIVSAVFSIAAGTLAIFQDHHTKDGKLTRFGWVLAALILASGVATLALGFIDRRVGDEKERADTAERDRQFQTQMNTLRGVTGSLAELQTNMRGSLGQQQQLFGVADQNLRMSAALQEQAQANTLNVLRRLFEDSNRISAERIAIFVSARCPVGDRFTDRPRIDQATLVARRPDGSEIRLLSGQSGALSGGLFFHGFVGDLGSLETFQGWGSARISIRITGGAGNDGATLLEFNEFSEEDRARFMAPRQAISCTMEIGLSLNGRQVLSAVGRFEKVQGTEAGEYEAAFNDLRVDRRRLPRFAN
jgi:hypothetical protein